MKQCAAQARDIGSVGRQATCRRNENQIYGLNKRCQNARIECLARDVGEDSKGNDGGRQCSPARHMGLGKCASLLQSSQKFSQLLLQLLLPPLDICISHINRIRRRQLQSSRHVHVVGVTLLEQRSLSGLSPFATIGRQTVPASCAATASLIEGKIIHVR